MPTEEELSDIKKENMPSMAKGGRQKNTRVRVLGWWAGNYSYKRHLGRQPPSAPVRRILQPAAEADHPGPQTDTGKYQHQSGKMVPLQLLGQKEG